MIRVFLSLFLVHLIESYAFSQDNSSQPKEYYLREKLVGTGCWPLNNVPDVWPVMDHDELPLNVKVLPFFEIVTAVDDKSQTYVNSQVLIF